MSTYRVRLQYASDVFEALKSKALEQDISLSQLANKLLADALLNGGEYDKETKQEKMQLLR